MKKVLIRILAVHGYYLLLLFFTIHAAFVPASNTALAFIPSSTVTGNNTTNDLFQLSQEEPKFTSKSSEAEGNKMIYTFNISIVNPSVEKVMEAIRQTHRPGATIAYEFHQFQLDTKEKTLKVVVDKNAITQQELLAYLQNRLNNALKEMK